MEFAELERIAWTDPAVATAYATDFALVTAPAAEAVVEAASARMGCRVLDIASGPGAAAAAAMERGAFVTALDLSPTMLRIARVRVPGLVVVRGSAERLPFPNRSFDYVVCNLGLLHFPRPPLAISEAARVLRRGGRGAWSVWGRDSVVTRVIPESMEALGVRPAIPEGPGFFQYAEAGKFEALLSEAAFIPDRPQRFAWTPRFASAESFLRMFTDGSARTRAGLRSLSAEDRGRVFSEVARRLETYRRGDHLEVPASVAIGSGLKP